MKILIAEDSALIRRGIAKVVTSKGFKAIEANNGAEALALLRKNHQDTALVILDWNMPVMDGYEVLVKVRSQSEYDLIPVLMATAAGVEEDVLRAIKAGANSYLVKPFKPEDMARQMDNLTDTANVPRI